jgi:hypothetical protein
VRTRRGHGTCNCLDRSCLTSQLDSASGIAGIWATIGLLMPSHEPPDSGLLCSQKSILSRAWPSVQLRPPVKYTPLIEGFMAAPIVQASWASRATTGSVASVAGTGSARAAERIRPGAGRATTSCSGREGTTCSRAPQGRIGWWGARATTRVPEVRSGTRPKAARRRKPFPDTYMGPSLAQESVQDLDGALSPR